MWPFYKEKEPKIDSVVCNKCGHVVAKYAAQVVKVNSGYFHDNTYKEYYCRSCTKPYHTKVGGAYPRYYQTIRVTEDGKPVYDSDGKLNIK